MQKRIIALLVAAVFTLSTTACAKDINEVLGDDTEVSAEASTEATVEAVEDSSEAASEENTVEASEESSEEASEEASEDTEPADELADISPDKIYKNDEFGVAVVIDEDMEFSDDDTLAQMTADYINDTGADSDNALMESMSYHDVKYIAYAEGPNLTKIVTVKEATLSENMHFPESAFVEMTSVRIKVQLENEEGVSEVTTEEMEVLGETHPVIKIRHNEQDKDIFIDDFYLIKDGRLLVVTVYSFDKADPDRILGNMKKTD